MAKNFPTNRDLLAELKRRGVTVSALAKYLRQPRPLVSGRLNNGDRPAPEWTATVLDACDAIEGGVPTA